MDILEGHEMDTHVEQKTVQKMLKNYLEKLLQK